MAPELLPELLLAPLPLSATAPELEPLLDPPLELPDDWPFFPLSSSEVLAPLQAVAATNEATTATSAPRSSEARVRTRTPESNRGWLRRCIVLPRAQ
jgi:hypothetical protein